jgi:type IV pilus assembly protein PilM
MSRIDLSRLARVEFPPPSYLSLPTAGIDISTSGVKMVLLKEKLHGLELASYAEERLPEGAIVNGEIVDKAKVVEVLSMLTKRHRFHYANIALSESRGYLFEAEVSGITSDERRSAVEQHIDEYVPLPPSEVVFDIAPLVTSGGTTRMVGVGYAHRVVDELLDILNASGIRVRAMEGETFALARALLPHGDTETVLIIDIGRTTTKLMVVGSRMPRYTTTLEIGGHALTQAVQKYFGVTEEEAKRVKAEKGLIGGEGADEYVAAMISTVSAVREEIAKRLLYWQERGGVAQVSRAILVGGNATVRGLPEYLEASLRIPVTLGDVFTNLAPRDEWLPPIDYMESLAYGTAVGLALREYAP